MSGLWDTPHLRTFNTTKFHERTKAAYHDPGGDTITIRDTGIAIDNTVRTFYELLYPILKGIHNGNTISIIMLSKSQTTDWKEILV